MSTKIIRRYTNFASLISILKNKELTLLDPGRWEDKNDAYYLLKYGERRGYGSLYALCFSKAPETSHHWKVFAPGADGVCIKINMEGFSKALSTIKEVVHGDVEYKLIEQVENEEICVDRLPFYKRYAFRDEDEYRVIYRRKSESKNKTKSIPFDINLIEEVTLSNSLPRNLKKPISELLRSVDGCSELEIFRSTLNENVRWKKASARAT